MVDVISKKCNHPGCNKHPSFGLEGTRNREFCAKHAPEGMIILGKAGRPKQLPNDRKRRASTGFDGPEAARYMCIHTCMRFSCVPDSLPPAPLSFLLFCVFF